MQTHPPVGGLATSYTVFSSSPADDLVDKQFSPEARENINVGRPGPFAHHRECYVHHRLSGANYVNPGMGSRRTKIGCACNPFHRPRILITRKFPTPGNFQIRTPGRVDIPRVNRQALCKDRVGDNHHAVNRLVYPDQLQNQHSTEGEHVNKDLQTTSMELAAKQDFLGAAELWFRWHEEVIAEYREAKAASDTSTGTKAVLDNLEVTDEDRQVAESAMETVRVAIFEALTTNPTASVLLYDSLRDYASDEVKDYRDDVIRQVKRGLDVEDTDEATLPEISADELLQARTMADSFWRIAGAPTINPDDEDDAALSTKKLKSGEYKLAFSNLPKNVENKEVSETQNGVTTTRLRYEVDGELLPAGTTLSAVGLWFISSPDWTVSVADIKAAVKTQTDRDYKDVEDFKVDVNNHLLRRFREKA